MVDQVSCWPVDIFVNVPSDGDNILCFCGGVARDAMILNCGHIFGKVLRAIFPV